MQKIITKRFIFLLLTLMALLSGCSRKNEEIVFTEPESVIAAENEPSAEESSKDSDEAVQDAGSLESTSESDTAQANATGDSSSVPETIMVHVCGAVLCEGVYELPTGSRVVDAVKAAGGFTGDADSDYINQALVLSDGVKVKIPTTEETMAILQNGEQTAGSSLDQGTARASMMVQERL